MLPIVYTWLSAGTGECGGSGGGKDRIVHPRLPGDTHPEPFGHYLMQRIQQGRPFFTLFSRFFTLTSGSMMTTKCTELLANKHLAALKGIDQ